MRLMTASSRQCLGSASSRHALHGGCRGGMIPKRPWGEDDDRSRGVILKTAGPVSSLPLVLDETHPRGANGNSKLVCLQACISCSSRYGGTPPQPMIPESGARRTEETSHLLPPPARNMLEKCVRSNCHVLQAVEAEGGLSLVACHTACCAAGGAGVPFRGGTLTFHAISGDDRLISAGTRRSSRTHGAGWRSAGWVEGRSG